MRMHNEHRANKISGKVIKVTCTYLRSAKWQDPSNIIKYACVASAMEDLVTG